MPEYNRNEAVNYAHKWAFKRNPAFYDFENLGGDCTNFVSQCIYAGCGVMNYTRETGWYYKSVSLRSPAWTGAPYLFNFLTGNRGAGPQGELCHIREIRPGDIIQLCFDNLRFSHSLFVVSTGDLPYPENTLVAAHSMDSDYRALSTYSYADIHNIKISGIGR